MSKRKGRSSLAPCSSSSFTMRVSRCSIQAEQMCDEVHRRQYKAAKATCNTAVQPRNRAAAFSSRTFHTAICSALAGMV